MSTQKAEHHHHAPLFLILPSSDTMPNHVLHCGQAAHNIITNQATAGQKGSKLTLVAASLV